MSLADERKILNRYESGNIKICEFYRNGRLEGERKVWYDEKDHLMVQEFFKSGRLDGERRFWYPDNQLWDLENYSDGVQEGKSKSWYRNGRVQTRCFYQNSRHSGLFINFYPDGNPESKLFFRNGVQEGEVRSWSNNGNVELWRYLFHDRRLFGELTREKRHQILLIKTFCSCGNHMVNILDQMLISDLAKIVS